MPPLICRNCPHGQHMTRCRCGDVDCTLLWCRTCGTAFDWIRGVWQDPVGAQKQHRKLEKAVPR